MLATRNVESRGKRRWRVGERCGLSYAVYANILSTEMFVEIVVVVGRREDVVLVPRTAVTNQNGRDIVFVLDGQRVSKRDVRVDLGDESACRSSGGLSAGARIVERGLATPVDGGESGSGVT